MTGKPDVIPGEKFALPVTWVRGIKLRLFAFSSVAASHNSFATGLRSGRPIFVLPLLRENKTPGCPIQRVLENDFVVVRGTGTPRDFIRLLTHRCLTRRKRLTHGATMWQLRFGRSQGAHNATDSQSIFWRAMRGHPLRYDLSAPPPSQVFATGVASSRQTML